VFVIIVNMRTKLLLSIIALGVCTSASADPRDIYDNYRSFDSDRYVDSRDSSNSSLSSDQERIIANERFETEMLRQEAQQETYRQQIASRQNSQRIAENSREIQENQRRYENNSNMINNVNQAANAATNVARQAKTIGTLMNGGWDAYRDAFNW